MPIPWAHYQRPDEAPASCRSDRCDPVEHNNASAAMVVRLAVEILVSTFLGVGSLSPAQREELDINKNFRIIAANGAKEKKILKQ